MVTPNLDRAWALHPQVSVRPEPFGALLYHFGTRRLSFLKDRGLLAVVQSLADSETARDACIAAGIDPGDLPRFERAIGSLAQSSMITERSSTATTDQSSAITERSSMTAERSPAVAERAPVASERTS